MGRYNQQQPVDLPMLASANQKLMLFSSRYRQEDFPPQSYEVHIEDTGLVEITGFPVQEVAHA